MLDKKIKKVDLDTILEEWKIDCVLDETKIIHEIIRTPSLLAKYIDYFMFFKQKLAASEAKMNKLGFMKKKYYRGELSREDLHNNNWDQYQGLKMSQSEIQFQFQIDPDMVDLKSIVDNNKMSIQCIEYIIKQIQQRDWSLKTLTEYQKWVSA